MNDRCLGKAVQPLFRQGQSDFGPKCMPGLWYVMQTVMNRVISTKGKRSIMIAQAIIRRTAISVVLAGILTAGVGSAGAEALNMRYNVKVSGIKVFKVDYEGHLTKNSYEGHARTRPSGFGGLFLSSRSDMRVKGRMGNPSIKPERFFMRKGKKKKMKEATVVFSGGHVKNWQRTPPRNARKTKAINAAIAGRTVLDPLSMLVREGLKGPQAFCQGRQRVFDGHAVYDIVFRKEGTLHDRRLNGTLYRCRLIYVPVAGMSEKKKRRAKADPPYFDVTFAAVRDRDVGTILVPVSATGRLNGKSFSASMKRGKIGGDKIAARITR